MPNVLSRTVAASLPAHESGLPRPQSAEQAGSARGRRPFCASVPATIPVRSVRRRRSGCAGFNHLDAAAKSANISEMVRVGTSVPRLKTEIAKCEVLCANCHQRYTITRRSAHYKTRASAGAPRWRQKANHRNAALVLEHLTSAACIDCAIADPLVLQFDHRPGEIKVKDIGWFVSSGSRMGLLVDELAKCDVRCANCHRRRTAQGRGWFRARVANTSGM
jgi:hypothetical protein